MLKKVVRRACGILLGTLLISGLAFAQNGNSNGNGNGAGCKDLPTYSQLKTALISARNTPNGGFDLDMWATVVNRDGEVCAVVFTGNNRGDQWPGSRVISAQKANTANAFSLIKTPNPGLPNGLALSTANLYTA